MLDVADVSEASRDGARGTQKRYLLHNNAAEAEKEGEMDEERERAGTRTRRATATARRHPISHRRLRAQCYFRHNIRRLDDPHDDYCH